jgi:hypothetical protein
MTRNRPQAGPPPGAETALHAALAPVIVKDEGAVCGPGEGRLAQEGGYLHPMPADTPFVEATHHLDQVARAVKNPGAPVEIVAQVGIGYAILALVEEVAELKRRLPASEG